MSHDDGRESVRRLVHTGETPLEYSWRDEALCAEVGFEFFYPEVGDNAAAAAARKICAACDVREECLEAAWEEEHSQYLVFGYRGGLSAHKRRRLWNLRLAEESRTLESEDNDTTRKEAS